MCDINGGIVKDDAAIFQCDNTVAVCYSHIDIVMDCRFLRNPHWEPDLRAKDGRDVDVDNYVAADERFDD